MAKVSKQIKFRRQIAASIACFRHCRQYSKNPRMHCREAVAEYQREVTAYSRACREA